ncbi:hypothetical protein AKJ16_DCAP20120 [Drosera capensis]
MKKVEEIAGMERKGKEMMEGRVGAGISDSGKIWWHMGRLSLVHQGLGRPHIAMVCLSFSSSLAVQHTNLGQENVELWFDIEVIKVAAVNLDPANDALPYPHPIRVFAVNVIPFPEFV